MNDKFQDEFSKWEAENYSENGVEINRVEENVWLVGNVQNNTFSSIDQKISQPQALPPANQILAQSDKIDFSAGTKSLETDEGYQTYLKDFYAENNSPEQVRKRRIRRSFGWALVIFGVLLGIFLLFSRRSYSSGSSKGVGYIIGLGMLLILTEKKPDEFGYRARKFAQKNNLMVLPRRTVVA